MYENQSFTQTYQVFLVWKSSVRLSNYSKTLWQTLLADSLPAFEALASYIHQLSHFRLLRKSWLTAVLMIQWNAEVVYRMSRQGRNSMLCSTVGYSPWPISSILIELSSIYYFRLQQIDSYVYLLFTFFSIKKDQSLLRTIEIKMENVLMFDDQRTTCHGPLFESQ